MKRKKKMKERKREVKTYQNVVHGTEGRELLKVGRHGSDYEVEISLAVIAVTCENGCRAA